MHVRLGATKDGIVKGIDLYTLSNTGAYGEHGPTTVGLSGHKSIPLYGKAEGLPFCLATWSTPTTCLPVRTAATVRPRACLQWNLPSTSWPTRLHMDPVKLREMNIVKEGDVMPAYYGAVNTSCALDRCLARVHEMIDWEQQVPCAATWAMARCAPWVWAWPCRAPAFPAWTWARATLKLNDDGFYYPHHRRGRYGHRLRHHRWLRSPPRCWTVTWTISPSSARIPTPRPMTPAPTLPLPPMSPARQWKSAPSGCAARSASWARSCWPDDRRCRGF